MKESCEQCRFSAPVESSRWTGFECRRNPPVQLNRPVAEWPRVAADSWCGEFVISAVAKPTTGKRETRPARAATEKAVVESTLQGEASSTVVNETA